MFEFGNSFATHTHKKNEYLDFERIEQRPSMIYHDFVEEILTVG